MGYIGDLFNLVLIEPLTNLFIVMAALTGSAGISIILLTLLIKAVTLPLQLRQIHGVRAMQAVQPRMQEINKRYKDPRRRQQEMMKLYREAGINPLGCASGLIIQMPILFALFRVFRNSVGNTPESLVRLSDKLYDLSFVHSGLPLQTDFLWMNLGNPDPLIMPVSVGVSMYMMQKLTQVPTTDEKQRAQQNMMNLMLPLMFGAFTTAWPAAMGLYWALSNILSMIISYLAMGAGPINWKAMIGMSQDAVLPRAVAVRQEARDRFPSSAESDEDEEDEDEAGSGVPAKLKSPKSSSDKSRSEGGGGKRRRRRYGRGRR